MNINGKPWETMGRKATGAKVFDTMPARPLIHISKPLETSGRKAMGAKVLFTMPAQPPDTLHLNNSKEGMKI